MADSPLSAKMDAVITSIMDNYEQSGNFLVIIRGVKPESGTSYSTHEWFWRPLEDFQK